MTRRILFRPEAEVGLAEATDWYESCAKGLGADFLRSLDTCLSSIQRNPEQYPVAFGFVRRALLRRFPYSLIYNLSEDAILVVACMHNRREPRLWQQRV